MVIYNEENNFYMMIKVMHHVIIHRFVLYVQIVRKKLEDDMACERCFPHTTLVVRLTNLNVRNAAHTQD